MAQLPKARINESDVEELAAYLCELDPDETEWSDIENALYDKYNVDIEVFTKLIAHLLPMIDFGKSPITKTTYKGFGHEDSDGDRMWLVKIEV